MQNIASIKNCYGCGVCATICPKDIITISLNKDGFYEPTIVDMDKCINCGLCVNVCAFTDNQAAQSGNRIKGYAAWSRDKQTRYACSSGGVGYEIGKHLISAGYKAIGVRYNPTKHIAEHYISTNVEEFKQSIGSKYIQSYTLDAFKQLNRTDKYVVIGTPCQIDSMRRYIKRLKIEDNYILIDFFCHGTPSTTMWQSYIAGVAQKSQTPIQTVSWRNKRNGWQDSWAISTNNNPDKGTSDYFSLMSKGDAFYNLFLGNSCLSKACYDNCKYKMLHSAADIRIGDLWGDKYADNNDGVSGVITFTECGNKILHAITASVEIMEEPTDVICQGQMKRAAKRPLSYPVVSLCLKAGMNVKLTSLINRVIYKIEKVID